MSTSALRTAGLTPQVAILEVEDIALESLRQTSRTTHKKSGVKECEFN
jgi:hypothetical protein